VLTTIGFAQVPSAQEKQGDFSDWPTQLYNPLTGTGSPRVGALPFTNNQIPSNLIAPQSTNLLKYWPSPVLNCPGPGQLLPCNNYQGSVSSQVKTDQYMGRIDHNLSTSNRLFGQWLFQKEVAIRPSLIPLSGTHVTQSGGLLGLQWAHLFSPRTLNEARFGYDRLNYLNDFETAYGGINYWQQAGLQNLDPNGAYLALPAISLGTNYSGIGNGGSVPFFNISNVFQYNDTLTMTRGRHSYKVGADIRRNQNFNQNGFGGNGFLVFDGRFTALNPQRAQTAGVTGTGNGFADFLLGYPNAGGGTAFRFSAFDQSFSQLRNTDAMFFFQDDFRFSPRLTINLGLRWELHTPFHDKSNGGSVFDFNYPGGRVLYLDKAFAALGNNPIYFACCAQGSLVNTDWKDFAPRIGFAWRPRPNNNQLVIRAGYGIFYDVQDEFYRTQSVSRNIPYLSPTLATPLGWESQPPLDIRNLFPPPYTIASRSFPAPYCDAPSQTVVDPNTGFVTAITHLCPGNQSQLPNNKTPYLQQWGLNVEYQIRPNLMVELGYQGSHGLKEPIQWIFNQASPPPQLGNTNNSFDFDNRIDPVTGLLVPNCPAGTLGTTCIPIQDRVPYRNFRRNAFANANILGSRYHAGTVKIDKRFSHGLQTLVAYTYGHSIDQFSEIQAQSGTVSSIAPNSHDLKLLWGSSAFDQTHRLVWNSLYELPFGKNKRFANQGGWVDYLVGGWQVNQITTLSNGTPFDIGCFCGDRAQIGNNSNVEHMDLIGNPIPSPRSLDQWLNPAAFAVPTLGLQGTAGRNIVRSTRQTAVDFSVFKNNKITERVGLQFRGEFFNFPSSETYYPLFPNNNGTSIDFGKIINRRVGEDHGNRFNPRIIQLALKLIF
jgi:hypothetical protein